MANPYVEIFRAPGAALFSAAGFLARLPLAMVTVGIVTMLSQTHGRYGLAGAVAATFALTNALVSPHVSRLVDRHGQARVLAPVTIVSVLAFLGLILTTRLAGPDPLLFVFALVAGLMPSMPAMVRARWTELYRGTPQLHTAFAFESVLDEVIYMSGSVLSIGLSLSLFPEAGPLAAAIILGIGTALFVIQKSTEPPVHPASAVGSGSALRIPAVRTVTVALAAVGTIFGTAEVAVIAFSEALGHKTAASWVLAGYAFGSLLVGIVYGMLRLSAPLARQFLVAMAVVMLTTIPPLFVGSIPALGLALFLAGGAISPTFITAFALIERLVPSARLTEGITWGMTGIGVGLAVGSIASGFVIDAFGAQSGFWISVGAGVIAITTAIVGNRTLRIPAVGEANRAALA
ncbi:MAG TPA: MFS transporter [Bauldia sp.]|nr:MFS transporter [Bauldia sp.]